MEVREVQSLKQFPPSLVTPSGIVMEVSEVHPMKLLLLIEVMPLGIIMEVREEQFAKHSPPR